LDTPLESSHTILLGMTERSQGFSGFAVALCWAQGLYFLATGVWPLVSVDTFQAV
jgi:hypothetical protein